MYLLLFTSHRVSFMSSIFIAYKNGEWCHFLIYIGSSALISFYCVCGVSFYFSLFKIFSMESTTCWVSTKGPQCSVLLFCPKILILYFSCSFWPFYPNCPPTNRPCLVSSDLLRY